MRHYYKCKKCEKTIRRYGKNKNLLCLSCRRILKIKICLYCDNEFYPKKTIRKYCSKSCASKHTLTGRNLTEKHKKELRLSAIKNIKNRCGQVSPNYNPSAIPIILQEAKKYNIKDLQHAENGGEKQVCGYFVDGYSPSRNVVIEYYESFHKNQVKRDERRKNEIIENLGCKFIEIKEWL